MSRFPPPYPPYSWPVVNTPTHFSYRTWQSENLDGLSEIRESKEESVYSFPSVPILKPLFSSHDNSDILLDSHVKTTPHQYSLQEPHSPPLHPKPTEDEIYMRSLWSINPPAQHSSTHKLRSTLHLSLKHPALESSFLTQRISQNGTVNTAELSGFKAQSMDNSHLPTKFDAVDKNEDSFSNLTDCKLLHTLKHLPVPLPHITSPINLCEKTSLNSNSNKEDMTALTYENDMSISLLIQKPDKSKLMRQSIRVSPPINLKLENLGSPEPVDLSLQNSPINSFNFQKYNIFSPSQNEIPSFSQSPLNLKFSRKRSLPISDSDSGEELPEVNFISESVDDCCFIVSTTTPRMAKELELSPSTVSLLRSSLENVCEQYSSQQDLSFEQSKNILSCESKPPAFAEALTYPPTDRIKTENYAQVKETVTDVPPGQSCMKQTLINKIRKTPLLSVTKTQTLFTNPRISPSPNPLSGQKALLNRPGANKYGDTPLHRLSQAGQLEAVRQAVLEQHMPVNAQDNAGWTALHEACSCGHLKVAVFLLEHGANPNIASTDGTAPVHDAVSHGDLDFLKLLVSYGADPLVNQGDISPLDMDTNDQIHSYLRETAIQRGHYHPGLPIIPDTPTSPTKLIQPARLFDSLDSLHLESFSSKLNIPSNIEQNLFYISPVFETRHESFLPTFFLPVSLKSGSKFMGNFYFLPDLLEHLGINVKEFLSIQPDICIFKFLSCEIFDLFSANTQFSPELFPGSEVLDFVLETNLLKRLLEIQIQNMEI